MTDAEELGSLRMPSARVSEALLWSGDAARAFAQELVALPAQEAVELSRFSGLAGLDRTARLAVLCEEPYERPGDFLRIEPAPDSVVNVAAWRVGLASRPSLHVEVAVEFGATGVDAELLKLTIEPPLEGGAFLVALPSPFTTARASWCVGWLELTPAPAEVVSIADRGAPLAAPSMPPASSLASDLAWVARGADLAALHAGLDGRGDASLEQAAWSFLAQRVAAGELDGVLRGVALRHAGAVASFPTMLEQVAVAATSPAALEERLIAENRLLLEDSDAAIRTRACDWLAAHGAAPAGFDPFAPLADRRRVLAEANRE